MRFYPLTAKNTAKRFSRVCGCGELRTGRQIGTFRQHLPTAGCREFRLIVTNLRLAVGANARSTTLTDGQTPAWLGYPAMLALLWLSPQPLRHPLIFDADEFGMEVTPEVAQDQTAGVETTSLRNRATSFGSGIFCASIFAISWRNSFRVSLALVVVMSLAGMAFLSPLAAVCVESRGN